MPSRDLRLFWDVYEIYIDNEKSGFEIDGRKRHWKNDSISIVGAHSPVICGHDWRQCA